MSGKFMSVKRFIIPTITMVIIASQLMGCAAANQNELLQMIQNGGEAIEIEVAVPLSEEQGTESSIIWEQLALLATNDTLRDSWDDTLGITVTDTGKNGILYVDAEGKNEPNNTLRVALHNREFAKLFEEENSRLELSMGAQNQYADIEADESDKALYMGVNGYFNLLPDATPNFSNPDSTLNRLEFMSMVMRAETPVSDITADSAFATAVGNNDLNIYAQEVAENSYLDIESKSLNNLTANGTMTRAEAVYLLMSRYFADELANVDISKASLSDAKDGGDFIEKAQAMSKEDITSKDYLKSYVLTYVITNPDEGVPTDLYKALVLAESKGIITSETRFDEGITKAEAVEMLVETLMQDKSISEFNAKQGTVEGYVSETPAEQEVLTGDEISLEDIPDDVQEAMDEIDKALSDNNTKESTNVSELAGTTSKHGYVYADDFNERGKRYEDRRGRLEQRFDQGMITEEQYQQSLKLLESTKDNGSGTPSMEDVVKAIDEATNPNPVDGSTTPGGGGAPIELPVLPETVPDGRICY